MTNTAFCILSACCVALPRVTAFLATQQLDYAICMPRHWCECIVQATSQTQAKHTPCCTKVKQCEAERADHQDGATGTCCVAAPDSRCRINARSTIGSRESHAVCIKQRGCQRKHDKHTTWTSVNSSAVPDTSTSAGPKGFALNGRSLPACQSRKCAASLSGNFSTVRSCRASHLERKSHRYLGCYVSMADDVPSEATAS